MPPKPVFKSSRAQSIAVAGLMGLVLLCATCLAYMQAGDGPAFINTPIDRVQRLAQPDPGSTKNVILFDLPDGWDMPEHDPNSLMLIDPDRPDRQLTIITRSLNEQANPAQMISLFVELHPDPSVRATLRPAENSFGFSLDNAGLLGAQFIGTSNDDQGRVRQHLLACLSPDEQQYWLIYLTDRVAPDTDPMESLRENARLLQAIYLSARMAEE
jgi:hypothetical protein